MKTIIIAGVAGLLILPGCTPRTSAKGYEGGERTTEAYSEESKPADTGDIQKSGETAAGDTIRQESGTTATNASNAAGTTNFGDQNPNAGKK